MKKTLLAVSLAAAGLILTSCATGTEPTATTSPSSSPSTAVTFSPSPQPESTQGTDDSLGLVPDSTDETAPAGAVTAEDARNAVERIEDELVKLSEVEDAQVVLAGHQAAVALKFDAQYQGGIDDRMREIVQERIDGVISGVNVVEITEDEGLMSELEKLGDRLDDATDMTELRNELDAIMERITGKKTA